MDVATASAKIEALFTDGGARLLSDGGLTSWWPQVLAELPADWLAASGNEAAQGETLLVNVREHYQGYGNMRAAFAITRELVRLRSIRLGIDHPDTLTEVGALGALLDRGGRLDDAGKMLERAYEGLREHAGELDPRLAVVCQLFALHQLRRELPMRAEQLLQQAHQILQQSAPEQTGYVAAQIGELMVRRNANDAAIPYLFEAWERYAAAHGVTDPRTVARGRTIAAILTALDREAEAIPVLRGLYEAAVKGGDTENRSAVGYQLGTALETIGRGEEALRLVDEAVRWTRTQTVDDEPHAELASRITTWSRMMLRRGRTIEAEGLLLEALEVERWRFDETSPEIAYRYAQLGHLCAQTGRRDEALGWLEPAAKLLRSTLGDDAWQTKFAVEQLVEQWILLGKAHIEGRDHIGARQILMPAESIAAAVLGKKHRLIDEIKKFGVT